MAPPSASKRMFWIGCRNLSERGTSVRRFLPHREKRPPLRVASKSTSGSASATKKNLPALKNSARKSAATSPPPTNSSPASAASARFASQPRPEVDRSAVREPLSPGETEAVDDISYAQLIPFIGIGKTWPEFGNFQGDGSSFSRDSRSKGFDHIPSNSAIFLTAGQGFCSPIYRVYR